MPKILPNGTPRKVTLSLTASPEELARWAQEATQANRSLAQWLHMKIIAGEQAGQ